MIKKVSIREDSGSFDKLLHIDYVITVKLIMKDEKPNLKENFSIY